MPSTPQKSALAFSRHNHQHCEKTLLQAARTLCEKRVVRLTPRRQQVLEVLLSTHQPMGAYEVLSTLNRLEQNVTPPIVYRALDFLQQQGLVHRIESKNAFIPCMHPGHGSEAQFLICSACERVAELENTCQLFTSEARELGFEVSHAVIEVSGLCADCRK
ncbi:MAG: transcriptional repressor [Gammaproteobacteria bacterium]|nr:transcriptional repressor [Gammaproteobacteria bacterium]MBL6998831.1 transcriptional repressor [Gammaproteobacteria bacterium]